MNHSVRYSLKDNNSLINIIYSNTILDFVINELLVNIDNYLGVFINNDIKLSLDKLNFDNLEILETLLCDDRSNHHFIINIHKIDLHTLSLNNAHNNETVNLSSNPRFKLIIASISKKINSITNNKTNNKTNNDTVKTNNKLTVISKTSQKEDKKETPIKNIFEETYGLIKKMENNNVNNKKRFIPTIKSSDSESCSDSDSESENENILNDIINSKDKRIEPNIPRQMNSVLFEPYNDIGSRNNVTDDTNHHNISISTTPVGPSISSALKNNLSINIDDIENNDIVDPLIIKQTIKILEDLKQLEKNRLDELKTTNDDDMENFSKFYNDLGDKKRELRRNLEREEEKRNRFSANKGAYRKMKQHIIDGKLPENKISELFVDEYPIFKFMDEKELLDTPDDYIQFLNIYNELYPQKNTEDVENTNINCKDQNEKYVPHNIHYLNREEQDKYKHIQEQNKDLIDEFINKNISTNVNNTKKYPSLTEVLDAIDSDDSINESNDSDFNIDNLEKLNFESPIEIDNTNETSKDIDQKINIIEHVLRTNLGNL